MFPKHISCVPKNRKALAPYNFVELPDQVVKTQELPSGDRYYPDKDVVLPRYTGKIECTLTTESPLYIRCGLTLDEFKQGKEAKDLPDFFYNFDKLKPVIPGSSIRGMLRTLVEIVSFGKIDRVSGKQKFFFRAVAAKKDDPLANPYRTYLKNVRAGYLVKRNDGWYIRPAMMVGDAPFVWIKESVVMKNFPDFIPMTRAGYRPQYIVNVGFGEIVTKNNRRFAEAISPNPDGQEYVGVLVTSGNMAEGSEAPTSTKRRNHCLIREPDSSASLIKINEFAVQDYCSSLTDFQKQDPPFSEDKGVLENGRCIFYCQPESGKEITLFGQSPNFRIPYSLPKHGEAASASDFIPEVLRDFKTIDFADAMFGFVRDGKQDQSVDQARSGRVFVADAVCQQDETEDIWLSNGAITPKILADPKPTTFQHYLVQPKANKPDLKHYGSAPVQGTVIRGHKLYWHKGRSPVIQLENPSEVSDTQKTKIKPIKPGVSFRFTIYFENLTDVELGALLWVLDLAQDEKYRLSLGMGKPLGMGAVKITHKLYLNQRKQRYEKLFADEQWLTGYSTEPDSPESYIAAFDAHIRNEIGATESSLKHVRRIKMLLAMLSWGEAPKADQTRYMEIECDPNKTQCIVQPKNGKQTANEYADRPVLPTPLQVIGWEECQNDDGDSNQGDSGKGNSPKNNSSKSGKGDRSSSEPGKSSSAGTGKTSMAAAFERATQRPKRS